MRLCSIMNIHPTTSLAFASDLSSMKSYEECFVHECNTPCAVGAPETAACVKKIFFPHFLCTHTRTATLLMAHSSLYHQQKIIRWKHGRHGIGTCSPLECLWQELWQLSFYSRQIDWFQVFHLFLFDKSFNFKPFLDTRLADNLAVKKWGFGLKAAISFV